MCYNLCITTLEFTHFSFFRVLRRQGLRGRVAAERSLLTVQNKAARVEFARRQLELHPDEAYWRTVIFTDEKTFDTSAHGRQIVYREDGTRFHPQHVAQRQVSGRVTVHCWGWMDGQGRGSLYRLGPRLNADGYMDLLRERFLPEVRRLRQPPYRFQQDHSPVHTARRVREMLEAEEDIELVPWMPRGADVSPIENMWGRMVDELTPRLRERRTTADQLWDAAQDAWARLSADYCRRLSESVPRRLRAVIESEGGWTGY